MILKIDSYCHDYVPPAGNELKTATPALFVAPNTAKNSILITVGRKAGDVVFADKSVSREHLRLTIDSERNLFLEDTSKFGNFIVVNKSQRNTATEGNDSETGDDQTDNEGEPQTGFNTLSKITKIIVKEHSKTTLQKVEVGTPLRLNTFLNENGHVIVQCGQNGSTIVITRVTMQFIFSRLDKTLKDDIITKLPTIGATAVEVFDPTTTHLVAKDRISTAKNLIAWLTETPIVTSDYVQALIERKTPSDPMPNESDYIPSSDESTFWNTKPNPKLWSHLTYLSLVNDDMEAMCRATGAKIVPIHKLSGKAAVDLIRSSICDGAFFVNSSASKYAKRIAELKKMKVPYVIQKIVASCASSQRPLTDVEGHVIGTSINAGITPNISNKSQIVGGAHRLEMPTAPIPSNERNSLIDLTDQANGPNEVEPMEVEIHTGQNQIDWSFTTYETREETETQFTLSQSRATRRRRAEPDYTRSQRGSLPIEDQSTVSPQDDESTLPQHNVISSQTGSREPEAASIQETHTTNSQYKKKHSHSVIDEELAVDENRKRKDSQRANHDCGRDEPTDRKKLKGKDEQGWFTTAPPGNIRKVYTISKEELQATLSEGQEYLACAPTCSVKGLIVGKRTGQAPAVTRRDDVQDFKRFRKNVVIRGNPFARIQLRSVLPRETELQRKMDEEDRDLNEEQRKLDALFSGVGDRYGNRTKSIVKPRSRRSRLS